MVRWGEVLWYNGVRRGEAVQCFPWPSLAPVQNNTASLLSSPSSTSCSGLSSAQPWAWPVAQYCVSQLSNFITTKISSRVQIANLNFKSLVSFRWKSCGMVHSRSLIKKTSNEKNDELWRGPQRWKKNQKVIILIMERCEVALKSKAKFFHKLN